MVERRAFKARALLYDQSKPTRTKAMIVFLKSLSTLLETHGGPASEELQRANAGNAETFATHLTELKGAIAGVELLDDSAFRPWGYPYLDSSVFPQFAALLDDLTGIEAESPAVAAMTSAPLQVKESFALAFATHSVFADVREMPELNLRSIHPSLGTRWNHDAGHRVYFSVGLREGHAHRDIEFAFVLPECPTSLSGYRSLASSLSALVQTEVASRIRDPKFWPDEDEKLEATRKFVARETEKLAEELLQRVGYLERQRIKELMALNREAFMQVAHASLHAVFLR